MKLFKLAILAILITFVSSCKDDDNDDSCSQSAWVDTYTGTLNCDGDTEPVTVNITASNGSNTDVDVEYVTSGSSFTIYDLTLDACNIYFESFVTYDIALDGDDLTYVTTFPSTSSISVCTITATRG